ncbi:hypothetical protein AGR4A_Lc80016 [Agrobacterium tumefaciens str. B6]|uniref:Uncharacterized protein n=1 Tax=Agrobacterium tumefaciens str. B6 TaxID=1183423 RepID=A0A822V9B8_AGRTU|nr:hypothetical protein AGR4A_Lc80016 [Agrobacterium tumefaciens str. B6]
MNTAAEPVAPAKSRIPPPIITSLRENRIRPNTAFTRNILTSSTPSYALTPKRGSMDEEHTRDKLRTTLSEPCDSAAFSLKKV